MLALTQLSATREYLILHVASGIQCSNLEPCVWRALLSDSSPFSGGSPNWSSSTCMSQWQPYSVIYVVDYRKIQMFIYKPP